MDAGSDDIDDADVGDEGDDLSLRVRVLDRALAIANAASAAHGTLVAILRNSDVHSARTSSTRITAAISLAVAAESRYSPGGVVIF